MKKKRLTAFAVALVLILSCGFSVFAFNIGIGDVLGVIDSVDLGTFPSYNETAWNNLSLDDRRSALSYAISFFGGTSHLDDDFLNSSQSLDYYNALIRGGNSVDFLTGPATSVYGEIMLERSGQADFGLGFYNGLSSGGSGGHFSGKFGDGTVADTLNDDFLEYLQQYPYSSGFDTTRYQFSNGYFINWEPLFYDSGLYGFNVDGVTHKKSWYKLRFYLYNDSGVMCDTYVHSYQMDCVCDTCSEKAFDDLTITEDGHFYYSFCNSASDHPSIEITSNTYDLPWFSLYGSPTAVNDTPVAIGTDDNGNQLEFNINSDGVTYEGNTYNYNDDNSVTINGDTYYITVNPSSVNDDFYKQFLSDTINNYYNYYSTPSTPFDDTDILSHLKSIFSSLERLRSDFYTQIRNIYNTVHDGFNSMRTYFSNIGRKLDTIIKYLKDINKNIDELTEEQEEQNKLSWLTLIEKFKKLVGWSNLETSMQNISTAFFGSRTYTVRSNGSVDVEITSYDGTRQSSSFPSLCVEFNGVQYDLFSCVGSLGSGVETIKSFISLFLWVGFIVSVFRSIPSIIGGVASVQDHSNNIVIDKHTGEVKKGG